MERGRRAAERNAKKATQVVSKSFDDFAIDRLKHLRNAPSDVLNADGSHLSHRFSEYCEAVESICGPAPFSRDRDPFAYAGAFCRKWKNRINLIHVNSALLSCSDTYRAQILDICAINDLSYNPAFNRALPTIILAHHNYAELAAIQREALKPILAGLNVRAYLNGDCHQRGEDNILLDGGRAIPCFTAPSIYKAQGDDAASIGFYLYEMDTDSPQWRVNVTSYRWIEWRWEIAPCRAIPVFNMRDIMLNVTDTKMNGTLPFSSQLADAVREAVRDYHEGSMYKRDEAVRTFRRNLFPRWKPGLGNVLACCDIFQIILEAAYEKYVSAANQNNQNYQEIARLGYVSKAYLVLAAIGTSGGALNLLAQMLINQANQYEADQRISFFRRHPDIDTFVQQHAAPYGWPLNDNYALAYRVLQSVCGIQRGSQPYSHMKKAELVLKGYVSESSSTQLTSLNIAINGGLAMGHYWKGRLLLEQAKQDHDRCNDYKDAAIASFCATNVTERFDHLPENADEDAAPQLSPPQWLSAIELLRYPDRAVFRVDRRMVFQTIYQKLTQQVEEVQSDNIQIHNERYRLTKKDVRSNLERCLDMVKAQFPDKEPLIQKMIRSIR